MSDPHASELLSALVRATALEKELVGLRPEGLPDRLRGPRPVSPGAQAALVVARRSDPADVLCLRSASPAAALALGVSAEALAHEAAGTSAARAGGRSAGGVPDDAQHGLIAAVHPPGTMMEVMAGVALAFRLTREPRVAVLVDDADDAASGYWHEGLNFAGVQKAPLVVVIDASARRPLTAAVSRITVRGPAYGVRGVTVEGDAPHLVLDAVSEAVARARGGDGTQLVEVVPGSSGDPIERLVQLDAALADQLPAMRAAAEDEARAAVEAARSVPPRSLDSSRSPPRPAMETPSGV